MKRLTPILILGLNLVLEQSCGKKKPVACFSQPQDKLEVGEQYAFKDCSVGAKEYSWDFGDGTTSATSSPTHTYKEQGNYLITLKVTGKKGEDELRRQITAFSFDLTSFVVGEFTGTISEIYPDSSSLDRTYNSKVTVVKLSNKSITVTFSRGAFDAILAGTAENITWNAINEPRPERLAGMTIGDGSFVKNTGDFKFTLTGTDSRFGNISWQISYTGVQNN